MKHFLPIFLCSTKQKRCTTYDAYAAVVLVTLYLLPNVCVCVCVPFVVWVLLYMSSFYRALRETKVMLFPSFFLQQHVVFFFASLFFWVENKT
jgi:hypothetical protein